jgi:hypothetical protein
MPEPIEKKDVIESQKQSEEPKKHSDLDSLDVKQLISIIEDTRGEAASRRIEAKQLKEKLEAIELKEAKEAEEKLKKNGDYEKILSEKEAKLADEIRAMEIESAKKIFGDNWKDEFENLSIPALKNLTAMVSKEVVKKVDHDDPTKQKKEESKVELTESDKSEALRRYPNLSPERAYELYKGNLITKLEREKTKGK